MTATAVSAPAKNPQRTGMWSRVSAALWRRPWARATILLTPPLAWFVLIYLASLVVLLITAFWQINPFTTNIERIWSLNNFTTIFTSAAYRSVILRTVGMAAAVTVVDAAVAFPFAYFMARIATPRTRTALFVAILLPLWASYLAKVYSWLVIFTHDGILDWSLGRIGLSQIHLIYTNWAVFTVFCYLWLPFMIIPVYAALERIPASQIEASQDLGGRTWRTTRLVLFPLALPGIVAGSIFTFSLTLGDYITPLLVGGTSATFMGNIIYSNIGIAKNVPFAILAAVRQTGFPEIEPGSFRALPLRAALFIMMATGALLFLRALENWSTVEPFHFLFYLVIAIFASVLKIALPTVNGSMSINFFFILIGLVDLGLPETMVIACAEPMAQNLIKPRQPARFTRCCST